MRHRELADIGGRIYHQVMRVFLIRRLFWLSWCV